MFEKGDIAAVEGRLGPELYLVGDKVTNVLYGTTYYKYKSLQTLKNIGEGTQDTLLKYDLYLLANTIKWSNTDLKFTITIPGKLIPIFLNKVKESWFSYEDSKCNINMFETMFIFEKNENNQLICRIIRNIELYYMKNRKHLFTLKSENLKDLNVSSYIIFDNNHYYDSNIRFEVSDVNISEDYGINTDISQYCGFVSQPLFNSGKKAHLSIKVDNKKLYNELYAFLVKYRYSAKATLICTLNDGQTYNFCLNNLNSIISRDWHIIDLEYVDVYCQVMDLNYYTNEFYKAVSEATNIPLSYLGFDSSDSKDCGITTASEVVKKVEEEYRLKQKYKELGLDKMDINSLFEGIDYSDETNNQEFVTFNKSDLELQYKMYNKENEKEKEKDMIILKNGFKSTKELKQLVINEDEGIVTAVGEILTTLNDDTTKSVTLAKTSKDDEFDKYVGAALAIAYQLFGSKTQFRKYVDNEAKYIKQIKEKKENAKQKKQGK